MKKLFFLTCLFLFISCSKDGEQFTIPQLQGQWTLEGVSCYCYFPEDYNFSDSAVTFKTDTSTLDVIHAGEDEHFLTAGSYAYVVTSDSLLQVDGKEYRIRFKGNNKLQLSYLDNPDIADDEVDYQFSKSGE